MEISRSVLSIFNSLKAFPISQYYPVKSSSKPNRWFFYLNFHEYLPRQIQMWVGEFLKGGDSGLCLNSGIVLELEKSTTERDRSHHQKAGDHVQGFASGFLQSVFSKAENKRNTLYNLYNNTRQARWSGILPSQWNYPTIHHLLKIPEGLLKQKVLFLH